MGKNNKPIDAKTAIAIMLKSGFKPLEPYKNSRVKWKCKCIRCKKISYPMLKHVKFYGTKCRYCVGTLVDAKDANKVMKKNKFLPIVSYPGGNKPWKSQCKVCNRVSSPTYSHVIQRGHCCKFCAPNADVLPDKAITAFQARGFEVIGNYKNTKTAIKVKCTSCKQIINKAYEDLMQGKGCSVCAGNLPLDKSKAFSFFLECGFEPLEEFKNVNVPWKSRCLKCNNVVSPTYGNVRKGRGCRYCAPLGINLNIASYLYLITNSELNSHKVGIGNVRSKLRMSEDRLGKFRKQGWETYKVWNFDTGGEAWKIESAVFRVVRKDLGLPIHLSKEQMSKTEGQTETINADSITLLELEKIIKKVIKGYRKYSHSPSSLLT
jgi:hypothetical protein